MNFLKQHYFFLYTNKKTANFATPPMPNRGFLKLEPKDSFFLTGVSLDFGELDLI